MVKSQKGKRSEKNPEHTKKRVSSKPILSDVVDKIEGYLKEKL